MTADVVLRARGIVKSFLPTRPVVGPCDIDVRRGEVLAIVGPSGSGKTTLLQAMAGLVPLDLGSVEFEGERLRRPSRKISIVFQDYGLFPWRTALRNVEFPLEVARVRRSERRCQAQSALRSVGLADAADKYPHQLSGGMSQRTAIARAIVTAPSLLLLDEPMSALDVTTKRAMQRQLAELVRGAGLTTVIVSHDLTDAVRMAERVLMLHGQPGRVVGYCDIDRGRSEDELLRSLREMFESPGGSLDSMEREEGEALWASR